MILQVITREGALSADYTLEIVIGICGFLVITLAGFAFYVINKNLENMREDFNSSIKNIQLDFTKFREDFHTFLQIQSGMNAKFEERTKDKDGD